MAGKATGRVETAIGLLGLLALATTAIIITGWNPWPDVQAWFDRTRTLSQPAPDWTERIGEQPVNAAVGDRAVLVMSRGRVEARDLRGGYQLWRRDADWVAPAGADASLVAVVGRVSGPGYDVIDQVNGTVRWSDPIAIGAWTFRDAVLSLGCPSKQDCTLASRSPADGSVRWTIGLSGPTRIRAGFNTKLLDLRDATSSYGDAQAAIARPMPRYLGFPLDGRVQIIDTQAGRRLREHETARDTRYVVAGNRVIGSRGTSRDGSCRYTVEARDAGSGTVVWRREGLDLRTASGAGCEPRRDPPGGGVVLVGTRGDNRAVLVSAVDGRELWVAGAGEKILTTDGEHALVRTADGRQVKAVALSNGGTAWTRDVPDDADVGLTSYATLITDAATKRLVALSTGSGRVLLDLETSAEVIGGSVSGLVLGNGRTVGYAAFSGAP